MTAVRPIITRGRVEMTDADRVRLREMMQSMESLGSAFRGYLRQLGEEIAGASIVPAARVEPDVVTMNSHLRVHDLTTGTAEAISLVYPEEADMLRSRLSVVTPLGIKLLGQRAGDVIDWSGPRGGGGRRLRIDRVLYQPEAAGHFHL